MPYRQQVPAVQYRAARIQAFQVWAEVTGVTAAASPRARRPHRAPSQPQSNELTVPPDGRDIFVPDTFAHAGPQPITVTALYRALYQYQINKSFEVATTAELQGFIGHAQQLLANAQSTDPVFVLLRYPERFHLALPAHTTVVASTSRSQLLAVERTGHP